MARQDEDIELVLGNKQLMSLFFVVVLFFAAFFSVGYTVGFGHGEESGPSPTVGNAEAESQPKADLSFPESLLKDAPEMPEAPAKQSPKAALERAVPDLAGLTEEKPKPTEDKPSPVEEKPKPTIAKVEPPKPAPVKKAEPAPAPVKAAAPAPAGEYHLQVAALRVPKDAQMLAGTLKDKGYPAAVNTGSGDGWNRVVVGPFQSAEAAKDFRTRLKKDGFDTMLRKQ